MPNWTKEQAAEFAAKGLAKRRANALLARANAIQQAENPPHDPSAAQTRLARLWGILSDLDKRLAKELAKDEPRHVLLEKLLTASRTLTDQAVKLEAMTNGKTPTKSQAMTYAPLDPEQVSPQVSQLNDKPADH